MSEQEQERPLTRRELRLREQAAAESAVAAGETSELESVPASAETDEAVVAPELVIEISPVNDDGSVRTRREIRALREAAVAEMLAAQDEAAAAAAESESVSSDEGAEEGEAAEASSSEDTSSIDDFDGPPTEAFSIAELLEAAQPTSPTGDTDAVAALFADDDEDETEDDGEDVDGEDEDDAEDEGGEDDAEDVAEAADSDADGEFDADSEPDADADADADELDESEDDDSDSSTDDDVDEPAEVEEAESDDDDLVPDEDDVTAEGESETSEVSTPPAGYSFPDIQPPEEWRSVFDDPSRVAPVKSQGGTGDFDDLISRAVAQEGSTGATGVSALILPTHPGDTGGLAGPLGATGELFVTGSIELPKSIGETGGHSSLLDSVETTDFLTGEQTGVVASVTDSGPTPVSALSAVSARRRPEIPVVAEPTKDKSKMPIILALSGGGLLIIIAGTVILAATQGWFG